MPDSLQDIDPSYFDPNNPESPFYQGPAPAPASDSGTAAAPAKAPAALPPTLPDIKLPGQGDTAPAATAAPSLSSIKVPPPGKAGAAVSDSSDTFNPVNPGGGSGALSDDQRTFTASRPPGDAGVIQAPDTGDKMATDPRTMWDAVKAGTSGDKTPTGPPAGLGRMPPIHVDSGPFPDREASRYQPGGVKDRLALGALTASAAEQQERHGGSDGRYPGIGIGEDIGTGLGGFLGGLLNPKGAENIKYSRDVQRYSAAQEAASKAATEEINRAKEYAAATHTNPYTGEVDPYYKAMIDQKNSVVDLNNAKIHNYGALAQSRLDKLGEEKIKLLNEAVQKGGAVPDDLKQFLEQQHMQIIQPSAGSKDPPHMKWIAPDGSTVLLQFDRQTQGWQPARYNDPSISGEQPYREQFGAGAGLPLPGGGGAPVIGPNAKGTGPYGQWNNPQEITAELGGHQQEFEALGRQRARAQAQLDALNAALKQPLQTTTTDEKGKEIPLDDADAKEERQDQRRRADEARKQVDKTQADMDKIQSDVVSKFSQFPGFIKVRPADQGGGWASDPSKLPSAPASGSRGAGGAYPYGDANTKRTGKVPKGAYEKMGWLPKPGAQPPQ